MRQLAMGIGVAVLPFLLLLPLTPAGLWDGSLWCPLMNFPFLLGLLLLVLSGGAGLLISLPMTRLCCRMGFRALGLSLLLLGVVGTWAWVSYYAGSLFPGWPLGGAGSVTYLASLLYFLLLICLRARE